MGQEFLVSEQIDAGEVLLRQFNNSFPVSAACWLKPAETDNLFLYIASDEINDSNIDQAYREINRLVRAGRNPWLDPFQVKLINSSDSVAINAISIRGSYPGGTWYNGSSIGCVAVEGVYIYPVLSSVNSVP